MKDIRTFGRLRANPNAGDHRFVRFEKVPEVAVGEDYFSAAATGTQTITNLTINGADVAIPAAEQMLVNQPELLQAWVENRLATQTTMQEYDVWVRVSYAGGVLTFQHRGAGVISEIKTDGPATLTTARRNNVKSYCDFVASLVGAVANITVNDVDVAMPNSPYSYSGTPATDAATAAQMETDIDTILTAQSVDYKSVSVTVDDATESYKVIVTAIRGTDLEAGAKSFVEATCALEFAA